MQLHSAPRWTVCIDEGVPSGKNANEEGAGKGAEECTYRDASIKKTFGCAGVHFKIQEFEDHFDVKLSEVGDGVSKVEWREGDVKDDESDLQFGSVGDSGFGQELIGRTVHSNNKIYPDVDKIDIKSFL